VDFSLSTLNPDEPIAGRSVELIYEDQRDTDSPLPEPPDLSVGLVLYPQESPTGEVADVSMRATEVAGEPNVDVIVLAGVDPLVSLTSMREHAVCHSASGVAWEPLDIRGSEGCIATNDAGIVFVEWIESSTSFHAESSQLDGPELVAYLQTWIALP
jgi:hypothetical protein